MAYTEHKFTLSNVPHPPLRAYWIVLVRKKMKFWSLYGNMRYGLRTTLEGTLYNENREQNIPWSKAHLPKIELTVPNVCCSFFFYKQPSIPFRVQYEGETFWAGSYDLASLTVLLYLRSRSQYYTRKRRCLKLGTLRRHSSMLTRGYLPTKLWYTGHWMSRQIDCSISSRHIFYWNRIRHCLVGAHVLFRSQGSFNPLQSLVVIRLRFVFYIGLQYMRALMCVTQQTGTNAFLTLLQKYQKISSQTWQCPTQFNTQLFLTPFIFPVRYKYNYIFLIEQHDKHVHSRLCRGLFRCRCAEIQQASTWPPQSRRPGCSTKFWGCWINVFARVNRRDKEVNVQVTMHIHWILENTAWDSKEG